MNHIYSLIFLITTLFLSTISYSTEIPVQSEEAETALLKVLDHMRNGDSESAVRP